MTYNVPSRLAIARLLLLMPILAGCATRGTPPPAPIGSSRTDPLACSELPPLSFSPGKPGASVQDVSAALARAVDPLGYARSVLGDTLTTRREIDAYSVRRAALGCR